MTNLLSIGLEILMNRNLNRACSNLIHIQLIREALHNRPSYERSDSFVEIS